MGNAIVADRRDKDLRLDGRRRQSRSRGAKGALYGFIGPNGAGKNDNAPHDHVDLFPDRGELSVLGRRPRSKPRIALVICPRSAAVSEDEGRAFLTYMAQLKGVRDFSPARAAAWLERLNLNGVQDKKCEELSKACCRKCSSSLLFYTGRIC